MTILLIYHETAFNIAETVEAYLNHRITGLKSVGYHSIRILKKRLIQFFLRQTNILVIFVAETQKRLDDLNEMKLLLDDKSIIFILADESKETLHKALKFYPKYFTTPHHPYDDLCKVLKKMESRHTGRQAGLINGVHCKRF